MQARNETTCRGQPVEAQSTPERRRPSHTTNFGLEINIEFIVSTINNLVALFGSKLFGSGEVTRVITIVITRLEF